MVIDKLYYSRLFCSLKNIFIVRLNPRALTKLEDYPVFIYYKTDWE